ncbi:MAG: hypothetical protein H0X39_00465 [Actinobacteria bacterium]|nr:hypothetical protein [Actinomycetota bacterium]
MLSSLLAQVTGISGQLAICLDLTALLATGGLHVYAFAGAVGNIGGEFAVQLSGGLPGGAPGDACNALVLATTISGTWSALSQVMRVVP